jgi:hypothetical protein
MRWAVHAALSGEIRSTWIILVENPQGKRPLERLTPNSKRSGLYGGCSDGVPPSHSFQAEQRIQFRSHHPMRFLGFSNHEKGAPRQEISKWSTVWSTFSRSGCSVIRSASLAKGDTSKKRPSPHLHKVPTRNNKVSPRTLQMALVFHESLCTDHVSTMHLERR